MTTPTMRAKLSVNAVETLTNSESHEPVAIELEFNAVAKVDGYPEDGSDENNTFARWTPSATLRMSITNPALFGAFKVGDQFYVDFTRAD